MQELYSFMATANSTLDERLEEDDTGLSAIMSALSLPGSVKSTPRDLPSAEASPGHLQSCLRKAAELCSSPLS